MSSNDFLGSVSNASGVIGSVLALIYASLRLPSEAWQLPLVVRYFVLEVTHNELRA